MTRYILIDRNSGYIFGDTADFASGFDGEMTPCVAALLLDRSQQLFNQEYAESDRHDALATYDVYRADINGSDAVSVIQDGQDQEMIEAVERDCEFVTSIVRAEIVSEAA